MFFNKKKKIVIGIEGMHCEKCKKRIETALESLSEIEKVKVNLKLKTATIYYENKPDDLLLQKTIEELGYKITGIKVIN